MSEDRTKPPPGYTVISDCDQGGTWLEVHLDIADSATTRPEAIAACWGHRDRVVADACASGQLVPLAVVNRDADEAYQKGRADEIGGDEAQRKHNREQRALGLEEAADLVRSRHLDNPDDAWDGIETFDAWLREYAAEVRRGD